MRSNGQIQLAAEKTLHRDRKALMPASTSSPATQRGFFMLSTTCDTHHSHP